jgi:hypothetical protein
MNVVALGGTVMSCARSPLSDQWSKTHSLPPATKRSAAEIVVRYPTAASLDMGAVPARPL